MNTETMNRLREREERLAAVDGSHKTPEKPQYGMEYLADLTSSKTNDNIETLHQLTSISDQFFKHVPSNSYKLENHALIYNSNVKSEIDVNNQVYGTFYKGWRKNTAVIILPNWNADGHNFDKLTKLFSLAGFSALRLSLPYHDERKPANWEYSKHLVSPNIGLTISAVRQAVLDVRCATDWLESQGYTEVILVGISIGSCIATITAAHDTRIRAVTQILMSSNFAEVVWTGIATQHIRKSFDNFTNLHNLKSMWSVISPDSYVSKLASNSTRVFMLTGKYDPVFLPHLARDMANLYKKNNVNYRWDVLNCGHYTLGDFRHAISAFTRAIVWISRN